MNRDQEEAEALLRQHGTLIRRTTVGHTVWGLPGDQIVTINGAKVSDPRAWKNALGSIRRALRAAGVLKTKSDEMEETEDMATDETTKKIERLSSLGGHVQRKTRTYEEVEGVADEAALAVLCGLIEDHERTSAKATVLDGNGNVVEGPLTVRVLVEKTPTEKAKP